MAKIDITRTELVWPGKYDDAGNIVPPRRVSLPFQVIERVSETRGTREQREADLKGFTGSFLDYWQDDSSQTAGDGWRNKLIWGDNLYAMGSLLERFAGKVDLIYIDPPFATGADFSFTAEVGDEEIPKEQSALEEKAYRDTWGQGVDSYLGMLHHRLTLMRDLLGSSGTLYIHCDWHMNHQIRCVLDEVFGAGAFVNEIAWHYFGFKRKTSKNFPRKHDTIFVYRTTDEPTWNVQYKPHRPEYVERFKKDENGRLYRDDVNPTGGGARTIYLDEVEGDIVDSVWDDIPPVNPVATERCNYATQKPEALVERIIKTSSNEGNLVADFFCGSGTTLAVAEKLGRRWIGCDLSRYAIHTTRKRLMDIPGCKPFEILNLGKYERQVWQGVAFGGQKQAQPMLIFDYLKFILQLYGAQPLAGTQHLHGKKGAAVVHVGAVDAPVTIDEVNDCLAECAAMKQKELHVLGWEWEMGLANSMVDVAKAQGIRLLLLSIPREVMEQQAVDKGDIHFYELAYLEAEPKPSRKQHSVTVELKDFVIPNNELIPPDVRAKIKKWSDYVDYWAVDWDFQNDTFVNAWTSYRTRRDRALALKSAPHAYDAPGTYRVMVKVIDIFGNDTSQVFPVEVA